MKRSKAVDTEIRNLWAVMASAVAAQAVLKVKCNAPLEAERLVRFAVTWLDNAGADAAKWRFRLPSTT